MEIEIITKEDIISLINGMPDHTRFEVLRSTTATDNDAFLPRGNCPQDYLLSTEEETYIEIRCEWRERHKTGI